MSEPTRGFPEAEFKARLRRAQAQLAERGLDALLLTTHPDIYYFSGFLTRFWESPTRPWFLLIAQSGDPIAVIPSIGADLMASTWIRDIRTWPSPDLIDDGVSLLGEAIEERVKNGRIGLPAGPETHLRMPLQDFWRLRQELEVGCLRYRSSDRAGIANDQVAARAGQDRARLRDRVECIRSATRSNLRVDNPAQPGISTISDLVFGVRRGRRALSCRWRGPGRLFGRDLSGDG